MSDLSRVEQLLRNALGEDIYEVTPQSRVEVLLAELNELIEGMGGGSVSPEDIATAVASYLGEHLTNPTNPPIDTSLSIAGAAADSKETGDRIGALKEGLSAIQTATASDVGKALKVKTVTDGKVTEWEFVKISDILQDYVKEQSFEVVTGEFVNNVGIIRSASNFNRSVPIQVTKGERYLLIATGYRQSVAMIAISNSDASTILPKVISDGDEEAAYEYDVESDGYIIVTYKNTEGCLLYKYNIEYGTNAALNKQLLDDLTSATDVLSTKLSGVSQTVTSANICDMSGSIVGFIQSNGTVASNGSYANYLTSDYLPIESGQTYKFMCFAPSGPVRTARKGYLFFDNSKQKILGTYNNIDGQAEITVQAPENAKYIRVSGYNLYNFSLTKGDTAPSSFAPYVAPYESIIAQLGANPLEQVCEIVGNTLNGKKWIPCGDSFTDYTNATFDSGQFVGKGKTYPRLIAERAGITIDQTFFASGRTLAYPAQPNGFTNSLTCPTADCYYQNIPQDADYITVYLGINDSHHASNSSGNDGEDTTGVIPIGTIDDTTTATYYGAWNVVLSWLMENRPFAHIGIIVSNGCDTDDYRTAQIAIATKYGVPYIDLNGDARTPVMLRSKNPQIASAVKTIVTRKQSVDYDGTQTGSVNQHPNWQAHEYESTFIENFLRSI